MGKLRRLFRWAWWLASAFSTAWTYVQLFGYTSAIGVAAITGLAGASALLEGMPYSLAAVMALSTFAAIYASVIAFRVAKIVAISKPMPNAVFQAWREVNEFMVQQAACLWEEVDPTSPLAMSGAVYARATMIKEALRNRQIQATGNLAEMMQMHGNPASASMKTMVSREELKRLATSRGLKPRFLFPDE